MIHTENPFNAFLYLLACGANGEAPDLERLQGQDLETIFKLSKKHSLGALVYVVLDKGNLWETEPWKQSELSWKWKQYREQALRKTILFDVERSRIFAFMENRGIWHMPLKGLVLRELYPESGLREMADNDILFDKAYEKELCTYMKERGYQVKQYGCGNHDVYQKAPIYNFEMHTAIYGRAHPAEWMEYYADIFPRLVLDEGTKYRYHFKDEDFYMHVISHAYKHYRNGGTGIQSLLDIYLWLCRHEAGMDWSYLREEMQKLNIVQYEKETRALAKKVFAMSKQPVSEEENLQLSYYLGSGVYGNMKNRVSNRLGELQEGNTAITGKTKRTYLLRRVFPNMDFYRTGKPFLYRHKILIPFFCIYRLVRGLLFQWKKIWQEIRLVIKIK